MSGWTWRVWDFRIPWEVEDRIRHHHPPPANICIFPPPNSPSWVEFTKCERRDTLRGKWGCPSYQQLRLWFQWRPNHLLPPDTLFKQCVFFSIFFFFFLISFKHSRALLIWNCNIRGGSVVTELNVMELMRMDSVGGTFSNAWVPPLAWWDYSFLTLFFNFPVLPCFMIQHCQLCNLWICQFLFYCCGKKGSKHYDPWNRDGFNLAVSWIHS